MLSQPISYWENKINTRRKTHKNIQPGTEQEQALADISRSALCCHSNKTHAPIANVPNSAQLKGTSYHSANLHPGPCSSAAVTNIHFDSAPPHEKCNNPRLMQITKFTTMQNNHASGTQKYYNSKQTEIT